MDTKLLEALSQGIDWMYEGRTTEQNESLSEYLTYEQRVTDRAAHSVGCHREDLEVHQLMDWFLQGLSVRDAANRLETELQEECYQYSYVREVV